MLQGAKHMQASRRWGRRGYITVAISVDTYRLLLLLLLQSSQGSQQGSRTVAMMHIRAAHLALNVMGVL
jgi:hypothetical protein